jgi:hypothetical protein
VGELGRLEQELNDLLATLSEEEANLAVAQEAERKSSREYMAFAKAVKKKEAAKDRAHKGRF